MSLPSFFIVPGNAMMRRSRPRRVLDDLIASQGVSGVYLHHDYNMIQRRLRDDPWKPVVVLGDKGVARLMDWVRWQAPLHHPDPNVAKIDTARFGGKWDQGCASHLPIDGRHRAFYPTLDPMEYSELGPVEIKRLERAIKWTLVYILERNKYDARTSATTGVRMPRKGRRAIKR